MGWLHMMRLKAPVLVAIALLAGACGLSPSSSSSNSAALMSFSVDSTDLGMQAFVAANEGMFAKHNINPVIRVFTYGVDGVDAMLTGQVNAGFACDFASLIRAGTGHIKILATTATGVGPFSKLIVRSGINAGSDLSGKTLGTALGTATQFTWLKYLESVGVAQSSVHFVNFSSAFEMVAAMKAGRIDGAFLWGPAIAQGLQIPGTKVLIGDDKIPGAATICLMVVDSQFLSQHRDTVNRAVAALVDASNFIKSNKDQAAQDLATGIGAKKQDALDYFSSNAFPMELTKEEVQHLSDVAAFQLQNGILKQPLDLNSVVDAGPLRGAAPSNVTV